MPNESQFQQLSDKQHLLLRPEMYCGVMSKQPQHCFINGVLTDIEYVPALIKITNELIDNCLDEHIRSEGKLTKIDIVMNNNSFTITDNGRGIPIEDYKGKLRPEVAWCCARAGTSFSENRVGIGAHGIGSFASNVFSKKFIGKTFSKKQLCTVFTKDNCSSIQTNVETVTDLKGSGTSVYIEPDFERFGVKSFSDTDIKVIKSRLLSLAVIYDKIKFTINGEKISNNIKDFLNLFGNVSYYTSNDNALIAVLPSGDEDQYCQYSNIDGLELTQGGTHEGYISRLIAGELKTLIKSKHRLDISVAEIKQGMKLIIIGKNFENMKFNSQNKEYCSNTESEIKKWLGEIDYEKLVQKLISDDEFIQPIISTKLLKQQQLELRELAKQQKLMNSFNTARIDKYTPSSQRTGNILFLSEGDCLEENTLIKTVNENGMVIVKEIKDVKVGDLVYTHNNRLRPVTNTCTKIKDTWTVKTKNGSITCSPEHRFYVYNTESDSFEFLPLKELDPNKHKMVKNKFLDIFVGFVPIKSISADENGELKFIVGDENTEFEVVSTPNHRFAVFNQSTMAVYMENANTLKVGDYLSLRTADVA